MHYIVITGGVISGIGKGTITSSLGYLFKERNVKVSIIKIDPYLNYDAGTMNPYQHGEVFVLKDGSEVDLDLGNYERFLERDLTGDNNITTGKVYKTVIERERRGDYLGSTVQIIPHVTDEIKRRIRYLAKEDDADLLLIEVGGVVGDIESMPFLEALRQMHLEEDGRMYFIHVTYVPMISSVGELKTKPTQHSVKELRSIGIQPDAIVARSPGTLGEDVKKKIALFTQVDSRAVIGVPDISDIFKMPLVINESNLVDIIFEQFKKNGAPLTGNESKVNLENWEKLINNIVNPKDVVEIGIVGKYVNLKDSYISHEHALMHVTGNTGIGVKIRWINSETEMDNYDKLKGIHGIIIPGGFGSRGIEGKIRAITYARENKIPILGICLGFQLEVVEYARNVLKMKDANSTEFDPATKYPVIDLLPEQIGLTQLGGTMRLGDKPVYISKDTRAFKMYGTDMVFERHRHRYEVNPDFIQQLEDAGLKFSAKDETGFRMEILELEDHPFFMGSQFHAEFKSRPFKPSVLHKGLVIAAHEYKKILENS